MAKIKTPEEIEVIREAGKRLARILHAAGAMARPGVTTKELDTFVESEIRKGGDEPAFLNYKPAGATRPYPATLCVSINDEAVHGIPREDRVLKAGDIVSLDAGLIHKGLIADMCITVPVGEIDAAGKKLIEETKKSLMAGIAAARGGAHLGDIGAAVEGSLSGTGLRVVEDLGGHGVGHKVHELPHIFHYGERGTGEKLVPGMVITIEPTVSEGGSDIDLDNDGYTYRTTDGSRCAQWEHTIVITDGEPEIVTVVE